MNDLVDTTEMYLRTIYDLEEEGVVPLRADWTRQDPRITETLSSLGRNAVPVYAFYVPGESEPRLLPEVLTPAIVLGELARIHGSDKGTALTQRSP